MIDFLKNLLTRKHRQALKPKLLVAAAAACFALHPAAMVSANPVGPAVVNGNVTFATQGNLLSVTNTPGAIINWQQFSIGSNEATRFIQQSAASAILNRVVGVDPSQILGTLQSNGRVFLINPNGILFGAGARIDVAGLVASTLNLSNEDFITGRMKFIGDPARAAAVANQGRITASEGGRVYLVGSAVDNQGVITAPNGDVVLAAGKSVSVTEGATPGVQVEITAPADSTINLSELAYGSSGIYAGLIRNSGVISANSVVRGADGSIVLKASNGVTLESGSRVSANGLDGGRIVVDAQQGTAAVSGSVEAAGSAGHGGSIAIVGEQTGLFDGARVDASGANAGGTVLIGGDLHGGAIRDGDLALANSQRTYVATSADIRADALESGDGGKVIVWADDLTRYFGTISAKGGTPSGNGGFVETSGKLFLEMLGNVDASAPNGAAGMWLLDPANVNIQNAATANGTFSGGAPNVFTTTAKNAIANRNTIQTSLNGGTSVTIQTTPAGMQAGNITVSSTITKSAGGNATLTLTASNNINVNAAISSTTGQLSTVLTAGGAGNVTFGAAGSLTTNNGNVTISSGSTAALGSITTGTGTLSLTSAGAVTQNAGTSLVIGGTTSLMAGAANNITLGNAGNNFGTVAITSGRNVTLNDINAVVLGASTVGNNLAVTAGGAISQNGALTIPGTSTFTLTAVNSDVLLNTAANNFTGAISFGRTLANVRDIAIRNTNAGASVPTLSTLTSLRNLTLQFDNTGVSLPTATLHAGGNLAVTAGGAVTQTGPVIVPGTSNINAGANAITLTNGSNDFTGAVTLTGGTTHITDSNALALGASSVGTLTAQTLAGNLTLNGVITASGGGDSIVLAAAGNFLNPGSNTLIPGSGRWLVYSANPSGDMFGNLDSGNTAIWNATFATLPPASVTQTGNRYLFSLQPTVTFTSTNVSKTYGVDATALVASAYTVSGLQPGVVGAYSADTHSTAFSGTPTVTSAGSASTAHVVGGPYAITSAQGSIAALDGYALAFASTGQLTVNTAPLTVTADNQSKTYGSVFTFAGTEFTPTGLQNSETINTVTLASAGTPATAHVVGGPYAITPSTATGGTFTPSDYTIGYVNGALTVNPAALTVTANNQSKTFGSTFIFTGNEFTSAGLQNSETIANISFTSLGSPAPAPVGPYPILASAAIGGTFAPSNYAITYVNGNLVVNPVSLPPINGPVIQAINSSVLDPNTVDYGTSGSITIADATGFLNTLPPTAAGPEDGDEPAARFGEQPARRDQADRGCFVSGPLTFMTCRNRRYR